MGGDRRKRACEGAGGRQQSTTGSRRRGMRASGLLVRAPTGDEAAARAMVARKDLSPHSAANTSANVEATIDSAAAPAAVGWERQQQGQGQGRLSRAVAPLQPHQARLLEQPRAAWPSRALTAAKALDHLGRLLLLLGRRRVGGGRAAQRLHAKPDEQGDGDQVVEGQPKGGDDLRGQGCAGGARHARWVAGRVGLAEPLEPPPLSALEQEQPASRQRSPRPAGAARGRGPQR